MILTKEEYLLYALKFYTGAMIRDYAMITLGVLTLLVTSGAVYGILTINTQIQAKPEQAKIPDYSSELDSLKSQVNSINSQIGSMNNNLAVLNTLKNNVDDIKGKLVDLESKSSQIQQTVTTPPAQIASLAIMLDKSNYLSTDTVKISAIGASPQQSAQIELLDGSGFTVIHKSTWSDSAGKIIYSLQLSSALPAGDYQIRVTSNQQTAIQSLVIGTSTTSNSTTTSTGTFTAQTDKSTYNPGDFIQVSGTGQAGSSVTGVLTSPSGKTYTTSTTIQSNGSYEMFFSPSQPYETGNWSLSVTNLDQSKTLSVYVGTSSSNSYTFTAQSDKSIYHQNDLIRISGTGQPNTTVTAVLTSPSGVAYTTSAVISSDGTYMLFFSTSQSYEIGNWYISVTNLSISKTLSISIQA